MNINPSVIKKTWSERIRSFAKKYPGLGCWQAFSFGEFVGLVGVFFLGYYYKEDTLLSLIGAVVAVLGAIIITVCYKVRNIQSLTPSTEGD